MLETIIGTANERSKARSLRSLHACHGWASRWDGVTRRRFNETGKAIAAATRADDLLLQRKTGEYKKNRR